MSLALTLNAQTTQQLSPRLQQSNRILQLAAPAFQQFLLAQLSHNPFLSTLEDDTQPAEAHIDIDEYSDSSHRSTPSLKSNEELDPFAALSSQPSLEDHLLQQLAYIQADSELYFLCALIINALDDNGYFTHSFHQLIEADSTETIALEHWQQALELVQRIAPTGVGARSLAECLELQIQADSQLSPTAKHHLLQLVHYGLDDLAQGRYKLLSQRLAISLEQLTHYVDYIRQLDPKPGRQYAPTQAAAMLPDIYVVRNGNQWRIVPNFKAFPRLVIHKEYGQLLKQSHTTAQHPLNKEWHQAQWLVESVEKRHHTVCEVAKVILNKQHLFFDYGDEALQPLLISEVATELGLHESTISRATSNKYMSTPNGVFSFRHFFSRAVDLDLGGQCSTRTIKAKIKQYIEQENNQHPLSDVQLHQKLLQEDIPIAKRTVTKYRQQLQLPTAKQRRLHH